MICSAFLTSNYQFGRQTLPGLPVCMCYTVLWSSYIFEMIIGLITLQIGPIQHFALLPQCFCTCCSHGVQVNSVCDVLTFLLLKSVMYCSGHIFLIDVLSLAMLLSYVVWVEHTKWNLHCARWGCGTGLCHVRGGIETLSTLNNDTYYLWEWIRD